MEGIDPRGRLLELAGVRGVSLTQLSVMIGRNSSYLQQFVRKGSPRKLEESDRRMLARFLAVDEGELGAPEEKYLSRDWIDIPRLTAEASAGPGALAGDEQAIGALRFSESWLRLEQGLDPALLSAIAVTGDSMEPTLRDGDEILVDCRPRPLRDGVHVVRVDEAVLVKRLEVSRPGTVMLKSDNRVYDPVAVPIAELAVIGRVVWRAGRL